MECLPVGRPINVPTRRTAGGQQGCQRAAPSAKKLLPPPSRVITMAPAAKGMPFSTAAVMMSGSSHRPGRATSRQLVAVAAAEGEAMVSASDGALKDWFFAQGGEMAQKVDLTEDGYGGVGLTAAADLVESEVILQLPPELAFAEATPAADAGVEAAAEKVAEMCPEESFWGLRLAARLLLEAKANQTSGSEWGPYLERLPKMVPGIPLFYPPEMLQELQYPPVMIEAQQRVGALVKLCTEGGPLEGKAEVEELAWAFSLVSSRAVRVGGPEEPGALLPICDFANHNFDSNARLQKSAMAQEYQMLATKPIAKGEEIRISYGPLSNDALLQDYGFVLEGNPNDRVQLRFGSDLVAAAVEVASDPDGAVAESRKSLPENVLEDPVGAVESRKKLLDQLTYVMGVVGAAGAAIGGPGLVNEPLWLAAQIVCAGSDEEAQDVLQQFVMNAAAAEKAGGVPKTGLELVPEGMRAGVAQVLQGVCEVALYSFPSSAEDDAAALAALPPQARGEPEGLEMMRLCLGYRSGRKQAVREVQRALREAQ